MVVNGGRVDVGVGNDRAQRRAIDAVFGEQMFRRIENARPRRFAPRINRKVGALCRYDCQFPSPIPICYPVFLYLNQTLD